MRASGSQLPITWKRRIRLALIGDGRFRASQLPQELRSHQVSGEALMARNPIRSRRENDPCQHRSDTDPCWTSPLAREHLYPDGGRN